MIVPIQEYATITKLALCRSCYLQIVLIESVATRSYKTVIVREKFAFVFQEAGNLTVELTGRREFIQPSPGR